MGKVDELDRDRLLERLDVLVGEEPGDGGAVVHEEDGARVGQVLALTPGVHWLFMMVANYFTKLL